MDRLLKTFCSPDLLEEVMGDLHERFYIKAKHSGPSRAKKFYFREVLSFARPYIIRRKTSVSNPLAMLKNYLRSAYRNLLSKKVYSTINIFGLSAGLTCCMLIFQYIHFEESFDTFHKSESSIYRILPGFGRGEDQVEYGGAFTPQSMAPFFKERAPEIKHITRVHSDNALVYDLTKPNSVFEEDAIYYADRDFLDMFSFPLVSGNKQEALKPGTALLSVAAAKKYFGDQDPVGKTISVIGQTDMDYLVAGILENVPPNSHLRFDVLLPMENLLQNESYSQEPEGGWSWNNFGTYVQLHSNVALAPVEQKLTDVFLSVRGEVFKQQGINSGIKLQPLADIHLNDEVEGPLDEVMGSSRTVYFFTIIGLVTFLIALVNYINLSTARALNRAKEVGVRKVMGAQKSQLITQFLVDAALTNIIALVLAVAAAALLTPYVNNIAQTYLSADLWMEPYFLSILFLTFAGSTLLSGLYPAFVLSSFKPVTVLRRKMSSFSAQLWLRKGLVVLQFAASIVLVAGTIIIYNQLGHMRSRDLGINMDRVVTVKGPRNLPEMAEGANPIGNFIAELKKLPEVESAAASSTLPGQGFNWNGAAIRKATDDPSNALRGVATYIDTSFARLYGLELLAGQGFEEISFSTAEDAPWNVAINEKLSKALGYDSPAEAINQRLDIGGYNSKVVAVYKDFNWTSAHQEQQNVVFGRTLRGRHISIRVASSNLPSTLQKVESLYDEMFPANVFDYQFLDQAFDQQYKNDVRFANLFSLFAGLAILIACLGLFGLAAFTSEQRRKEIGLRKVLGASVANLVSLLNMDFLKLVLIGFVLAVPIGWYIMEQWLQDFAYRIDIGAGEFLLAGLAALLIALATVSWQSIKAAVANPVESLRDE